MFAHLADDVEESRVKDEVLRDIAWLSRARTEASDTDGVLVGGGNNGTSSCLRLQGTVPKIGALMSSPQSQPTPSAPPASPSPASGSGVGGRGEAFTSPPRSSGNAVSSTAVPTIGGRGGFRTSPGNDSKQVRRTALAQTNKSGGRDDDMDVLSVKEYWRSVLGDEASADVRLAAGSHADGSPSSERLHAHRVVLSRVPFFRRLLASTSQARRVRTPAVSKDVVVRGVTLTALRRILLYVYTDDANEAVAAPLERPGDLLAAADVCGLPILRAACEDMHIVGCQRVTMESCDIGGLEAEELEPSLSINCGGIGLKQVEELADENERLRREVQNLRSRGNGIAASEVAHESARSRIKTPESTRLSRPLMPLPEPTEVTTGRSEQGDSVHGSKAEVEIEDVGLENVRALSNELQAQLIEIQRLQHLLKQRNNMLVSTTVFHDRGLRDSVATDSTVAIGSAVPSSGCSPRSAISPSIAMEVTRQVRQLRVELENALKDRLRDSVREQVQQELDSTGLASAAQVNESRRLGSSHEAVVLRHTDVNVLRVLSDSPPVPYGYQGISGRGGTVPVWQQPDSTREVDGTVSVEGSAVLPVGNLPGSAVLPMGSKQGSVVVPLGGIATTSSGELPPAMGISPALPTHPVLQQEKPPARAHERSVSPMAKVSKGRLSATTANATTLHCTETGVRRSTPRLGKGAAPPPTRQASALLGTTGPSRSRSGTPTTTTKGWRGPCKSAPRRNSPGRVRVANVNDRVITSRETIPFRDANLCRPVLSNASSLQAACSGSMSVPMPTAVSRQLSCQSLGTAMSIGCAPPVPAVPAGSIPRLVGPFPRVTWQYYQVQPEAVDTQSRSRSGSPAPIEADSVSNSQPPTATVIPSTTPATERNRGAYRQKQPPNAVMLAASLADPDCEQTNPVLKCSSFVNSAWADVYVG